VTRVPVGADGVSRNVYRGDCAGGRRTRRGGLTAAPPASRGQPSQRWTSFRLRVVCAI